MAHPRKIPKSKLYPERYKTVILNFKDSSIGGEIFFGAYTFSVPRVKMSSFKKQVYDLGGQLETETTENISFSFKGDGAFDKVNSLALPYMYN